MFQRHVLTFLALFLIPSTIWGGAPQSKTEEKFIISTVMNSPEQAEKLGQFMDSVLNVGMTEKTLSFLKGNATNPVKNDKEIYRSLLKNVGTLRKSFFLYQQLQALYKQKEVLGKQTAELIQDHPPLDGYIEIGTPGTYINEIKKYHDIQGKIYIINDDSSVGDYFQAFSWNPFKGFHPYDHRFPLDDYAPMPLDIPDNSIDLITCYIGIHHIPDHKMNAFLTSIYRVLRPGGKFILRDHDAANQDLYNLIYSAHFVFNALMDGDSVEAEVTEIRNFHPLSYWIKLISSFDFKHNTKILYQDGDSTLNALFSFTKRQENKEQLDRARDTLKKLPEYEREFVHTFLSTPEWHNVDITDEYNDFIVYAPFYEFPFFSSANSFWEVFYKSLKASIKHRGFWETITSEYMMMDTFIGLMMTAEYYLKAILSLPLKLLFEDNEATYRGMIAYDPQDELDNFHKDIQILTADPSTHIKAVKMPRHRDLRNVLRDLMNSHIRIIEFSGQTQMQLKVRFSKESPLPETTVFHVEYTYTVPTRPDQSYAALTVEVSKLFTAIKFLHQHNVELLHAHDF